MITALLVIDVQQALCSGEYAAFDIENVIARINLLSQKARESNAPVIFVQHEENEGPLPFGGAGWQLAQPLVVTPEDIRVRKKTPNSFHETSLQQMLKERGVSKLVICGLQSDFCVDTTVRQALPLGYDVVLVADAHSTLDNGVLSAAQIVAHHNQTLRHMTSFGRQMSVKPANEVSFSA